MNDTPSPEETPTPSGEQPPQNRQPKPVPETLSAFLLTNKAPAKRFVQALGKRPALNDDDLARSLEIINEEPAKMGRIVELARAAAFSMPQPGALLRWCEQVLRSRDETLRSWALDPSQDARAALGSLLTWASSVRKQGDRSKSRMAESSVLLGYNLLFARRAITPLEALRMLASKRGGLRETNRGTAIEREISKLLAQANYKHLFDFARIVGLSETEIASAENAARRSAAEVDVLRRQMEVVEAETDALRGKIDTLNKSLAERDNRVVELSTNLAGTRTRALQDLGTLKARFRRQIGDHLAGLLADAWDAIDTDPPHPNVARERLEIARDVIKKELEWLDKSSD